MNVGIIGCGNISTTYLELAPLFHGLTITAVSDLDESRARAQAEEYGCEAMTVENLLRDSSIEAVINLTVPAVHAEVSTAVVKAGKHVYSEKPYVLTLDDGLALGKLAEDQKVRIGSAPDTFLGGAHQAARALVDSDRVGAIVGGSCHFMNHGLEDWHPDPDFFYQPGGGPVLDMGPYYISNLVQLIGPVSRVVALTSMPFSTRTISSEPRAGEIIPVGTATSAAALLEFVSGAQITLSMSWDVWSHEHNCMELYGTNSTLYVPDPNFFGGELRLNRGQEDEVVAVDHPLAETNQFPEEGSDEDPRANYRGIGLADMIAAIGEGRAHRCDNRFALHVIDVMTSILKSGEEKRIVDIASSCERPAALDGAAARALLA